MGTHFQVRFSLTHVSFRPFQCAIGLLSATAVMLLLYNSYSTNYTKPLVQEVREDVAVSTCG